MTASTFSLPRFLIFIIVLIGFFSTALAAPVPKVAMPEVSKEDQIASQLAAKYKGYAASPRVVWDSHKRGLSRINGLNIPVEALSAKTSQVDESNGAQIAESFISDNAALLGIDFNSLRLAKIWSHQLSATTKARETIVHFDQVHNGIPVLGGGVVLIFKDDRLALYKSSYVERIETTLVPALTSAQALNGAAKLEVSGEYARVALFPKPGEQKIVPLPLKENEIKLKKSRLVIYPHAAPSGFTARLAWELWLTSSNQEYGLDVSYLIDAQTGFLLARRNLHLRDSIWGKVRGAHFQTSPYEAGFSYQIVDLPGVLVSANPGAGPYYSCTSDYGDYEIDNLPSPSSSLLFSAEFGCGPLDVYNYSEMYNGQCLDGTPCYPIFSGTTLGSSQINTNYDHNVYSWEADYWGVRNQASNLTKHFDRLYKFFGRDLVGVFDVFGGSNPPRVAAIVNSNVPPDYTYFSMGSSNLMPAELEDYYAGFFFFEGQSHAMGGALACEAAALDSDIINHEFSHFLESQINPSSYNQYIHTIEGAAVKEALADYWAASMNDDPQLLEGSQLIPTTCGVGPRTVANTLSYINDWDPLDEPHELALILSGALWDLRVLMRNKFGTTVGTEKSDELVMQAMKSGIPFSGFTEVLQDILSADQDLNPPGFVAPNLTEICTAFCSKHDICPFPDDCSNPPTPGPTPIPSATGGVPRLNKVNLPVNRTYVDSSFSELVGSASAPNLSSFGLSLRKYGGVAEWSTQEFSAQGGTQNVIDDVLGYLNSSSLTNGCYYDVKLTSQTADGSPPLESQITMKYQSGIHDPMPRMVCVFRTANEGGENDACEMLAIVSDPKPAYYSLTSGDWRKGRPHLLLPRPNQQYNGSAHGSSEFGPALCDPDNNGGDCLRDCWNIIGTNSNGSGGNDGIDNVFCKAGSGCSPVSFSGCPSDDQNCVNTAVQGLEAAYHKVLYFHYTNWDMPCFPWPWGHVRRFMNCSDDGGPQFYSLYGHVGSDCGAPSPAFSRTGQAATDRRLTVALGDIFDGFDELYSSASGPAVISLQDVYTNPIPRVDFTPAPNCSTCGCPASHPYCNTSGGGVCETKCSDGTPFGQCAIQGGEGWYCENGTRKLACGTRCPGANCPAWLSCNAQGWCDENPSYLMPAHDATMSYYAGQTEVFGGPYLWVGYRPGDTFQSFFKFDLTALPPNTLEKAWLRLQMVDYSEDSPGPVPRVYLLNNDYGTLGEEDYNASGTLLQSLSVGSGPAYYIDVTSSLHNGINAFMLKSSSTNPNNHTNWWFGSSVYSNVDQRVRLVYQRKSTGCQPISGGGGVGKRVRPGPAVTQGNVICW